jgi:hypothetical protein
MEPEEIEQLLPQINVNVPQQLPQEERESIIPPEMLLSLFAEALDDVRKEKEQLDSLIDNFVDMVINEGDSTTSSKEALVNLVKIKTDTTNNKTKIIDLITRIHLKEKDTFPKYLSLHAQQTNNIAGPTDRRELIKTINKIQKKRKEQGNAIPDSK